VPPTSPNVPPAPTPVTPEVRYGPSAALPQQADWRAPSRPDVRLSVPETSTAEPPRAPEPAAPTTPADPAAPSPALPVGIPQFAQAKDRVASGLRPLLDGMDWLQTNGYRTVLHVRPPGEDDSSDRRLAERRGLRYLTLEVSPQTLSRALVDSFQRIVNDTTAHPLFVYDRDGMLAGGLWYLAFRAEGATDEEARQKAARLGLKDDAAGEHQTMWLAIQKVLSATP
jgi:protein tyrosine phosphatase (PTP) superfamily phosphohydrolase (DUF442 family)